MLETNIHPTAIISPTAILEEGVKIGPYTLVGDDVHIGRGTVIGPHVQIEKWTTIGEECKIFFGATIGNESKDLKYGGCRSYVKIGNRNILREYVSISRSSFEEGSTIVGDNNLLMNWVNLAHDTIVGSRIIMANFVSLAGHVVIEDDVRLGAHAALHQYVRVGKMAMAGGFSKIVQDIPPFILSAGQPARVRSLNRIGIRTSRINPLSQLTSEALTSLKKAFSILFRSGLPLSVAVAQVRETRVLTPEVEYLLKFIETSKRGVGFSQPNRTLNG